MKRIGVGSVFVVLAGVGCGQATLRETAAKDMKCPAAQVKGTNFGGEEAVLVSGCSQRRIYWRKGFNRSWVPTPDIVRRASFDLKCKEENLDLTALSEDGTKAGVRGCGRQATYILERVDYQRWEWVMNSVVSK